VFEKDSVKSSSGSSSEGTLKQVKSLDLHAPLWNKVAWRRAGRGRVRAPATSWITVEDTTWQHVEETVAQDEKDRQRRIHALLQEGGRGRARGVEEPLAGGAGPEPSTGPVVREGASGPAAVSVVSGLGRSSSVLLGTRPGLGRGPSQQSGAASGSSRATNSSSLLQSGRDFGGGDIGATRSVQHELHHQHEQHELLVEQQRNDDDDDEEEEEEEEGRNERGDTESVGTMQLEDRWPTTRLLGPDPGHSVSSLDPRKIWKARRRRRALAEDGVEGEPVVQLPEQKDLAEAWIQIACVELSSTRGRIAAQEQAPAAGSLTRFHVFLTSVGVSLVHAERRLEILYLIGQRVLVKAVSLGTSRSLQVTMGNLQMDSHDPNAQFPIVLVPEQPPATAKAQEEASYPDQLKVRRDAIKLDLQTRHQQFLQIESACLEVLPLKLRIEESLLDNLVRLVSKSVGEMSELAEAELIQHPLALSTDFVAETSALKDFVYVHWLKLAAMEIALEAQLEGGLKINQGDELSVYVSSLTPLLSTQVRLNFREFSRSNEFEPEVELIRKLYAYVLREVLFRNASKVLSSTSAYFNPLPPVRSVLIGFAQCFRQPYLAIGRRGAPGCLQGCQLGLIGAVSGISSGLTEIVFMGSRATTSLISNLAQADEYDVVSRPIAVTFAVTREVAKAIAESSQKISEDLLKTEVAATQVRKPAVFTARGQFKVYGPGNYPMREELRRQRIAAMIIKQRRTKALRLREFRMRNKFDGVFLSAKDDLAKLIREQQRRKSWWARFKGAISLQAEAFWHDFKNARVVEEADAGETQRLV
jgi:hypothetical protein